MANVYGMTGGVSEAYSGQKSIRPTTVDIELDTEDKILESDLTIQGDSNLVGNNIKYGSNIFGVNGTGIPVNFHGGVGTAFRNGVSGLGDVVNEINDTDKKYVRQIGEMKFVANKYPFIGGGTLVFRSSTNPDVYAIASGISRTTITFYNQAQKIYSVTLDGGDKHFNISAKEDALYVAFSTYENDDEPGFRTYIYILRERSTITQLRRTLYQSIQPTQICVTDQKIALCAYSRSATGTTDNMIMRTWELDLQSKTSGYTAAPDNMTEDILHRCAISLCPDQRLYLLAMDVPGASKTQIINNEPTVTCYLPESRQKVFQRWIGPTLLGLQTIDDVYCTFIALWCDGINGHIYYWYSNVQSLTFSENTSTYLAVFDYSMNNKIQDIQCKPNTSYGLSNGNNSQDNHFGPGFYFDTTTNTMLYWGHGTNARLGLNGEMYAYSIDEISSYQDKYECLPYMLSNGQVDFCYESNALEDTSVTTVKTITTDTYTATIEEV